MPDNMLSPVKAKNKKIEERESVVVRFAGDSGDGIQLTGMQFANESALAGSDVATMPNYPAEIRAPSGSLQGVSAFQIHIGAYDVQTTGDRPDVLVAFNPAALKVNLPGVKQGGVLIVNEDAFTDKNLEKAGYPQNPLRDESLAESYRLFPVPISTLTKQALKDSGLKANEIERCKNFLALGVMLWMFNRPATATLHWIETKFAKNPQMAAANRKALEAGIAYAEATEIFSSTFLIKPAALKPGTYRNLDGTAATVYGLLAASQLSGLKLFLGAYPITPASDILHELSRHKRLGVVTFQAEDEIAAIGAALGASYAGALGVTSTSGPGMSLKSEFLGLAVMTELPLVVINVQRAGPSTGMPTKTEQADLLQALFGRHGEAPLCVLAASSPSDCFPMAYEACRIAVKYMTPVILLTDGYIINGAEPWRIPEIESLRPFEFSFARSNNNSEGDFLPYARDPATLARPWAVPGTPSLMHRIGGLEKEDGRGGVTNEPLNHHIMCQLRAEKIEKITAEIPPVEIDGKPSGELLVLGWGSTEGAISEAVRNLRQEGKDVSRIHLRHLNPLPSDLGSILARFARVLIPEGNLGQLAMWIRAKYLVDARGYNRITGQPLGVPEIEEAIRKLL